MHTTPHTIYSRAKAQCALLWLAFPSALAAGGSETTLPIEDTEEPTIETTVSNEASNTIELIDESSERVGFSGDASPLDTPAPKKESSEEPTPPEVSELDPPQSKPTPETPAKPPMTRLGTETQKVTTDDESSERVGFGSSTSPLDKAPHPTKEQTDDSSDTDKTEKQPQEKEQKSDANAEPTESTKETKAKEPAPLEAPDDSSERVGFGSSTSPLDKEPEPKKEPAEDSVAEDPKAKDQTEAPADSVTEQPEAKDDTPAPETPDTPPEKQETRPSADDSASASDPAMIDQVDDSSERVGFKKEPSPLEEPIPPPSAWHNTGIPFVDDTVYFIAPRAYYRYFDSGRDDTSEAFAIGGSLGLKSGKYKNFASVRLTAHTSQKVMSSSDDQDEDDSAGLLRGNDSYSEITEANLNLHSEIADFRIGIQRIDLPYLNSNDTRMVPNTYKAYTLKSQATEKLGLELGYVDGMRERTGSDYESLSEQAGAEDSDEGVYLLGARYVFSDNANVGAVQLHNPNVLNAFYIEANAVIPFFELIHLDAGFQFSDQRTVGDELLGHYTTQQYGFKLRAKYEKLVSTLVFTHTGSDHAIETPWGGSPSYNSMMISDFDRAGEKAVGGSMSYRFSGKANEGFVSSVRWTYGNTPDSGSNASSDQYELNWNLDFYPKEIPNLWFRLRFARNYQVDSDYDDARDIRFIVNYVKTF